MSKMKIDSTIECDIEIEQNRLLQHVTKVEDDEDVHMTVCKPRETQSTTSSSSLPVNAKRQRNAIKNYPIFDKNKSMTRRQEIDSAILFMIVKGNYPLSMIEGIGFRKLMHFIDPTYTLPNRETFAKNILMKEYNTKLEFVRNKIKEASSICITMDSWVSIDEESYIAITAHFINEKIELCSLMLFCIEYYDLDSSKYLSEVLEQKFVEWDINSKICVVVSNSKSCILDGIQLGGWQSLTCFAHNVNTILLNILKFEEIDRTISKVREIGKFFKYNDNNRKHLQEIQKQMNLPELKLKVDNPSRWHSTFIMLQRIVKLKYAVIETITFLQSDLSLSNEDWEIIEKTLPILNVFYELTTDVSGDKYPLASKVIVYCNLMISNLDTITEENNKTIQTFLQNLKSDLRLRFGEVETNTLLAEATILDPRFKSKGFLDIRNFYKALTALKLKFDNSNSESSSHNQPVQQIQSEPSLCSIWSKFDGKEAQTLPQNITTTEIKKYLLEPIIKRQEDPLAWWKSRKAEYPLLYSYLLKRLNIPATCIPFDRLFSKEGTLLYERRTVLDSDYLFQMIFVSANSN